MKRKGIKLAIAAVAITMMGSIFAGCAAKDETAGSGDTAKPVETSKPVDTPKPYTLTISGSTSVGPLMEKEAKAFMDKNKHITIEIQQIGSSAGIKNSIDGVSELGMSSRDLKAEERAAVKEEIICFDGIAVIVHPNNTAENLTMAQIKDIYTGKITNWKEVGGKDAPIVVVSREEGSGTRGAWEEIVKFKAEEMIKTAQIADGNGAVKTNVSKNENAIGYLSFEVLFKDGKPDPVIKGLKVGGVDPTPENVIAKTYLVSRPFIVTYKEGKLSQAGKDLIDFIKSPEGQKIVKDSGAIPLK